MRKFGRFLICFLILAASLFTFGCFDDDEDEYYNDMDDDARELFYEYYGYYPDEDDYYDDDNYYDYDDEDYDYYDEEDYDYDDDDYYDDDDDGWFSYLLDLFGLGDDYDDDSNYDDDDYYDDEGYDDYYDDDDYGNYNNNNNQNNFDDAESAYDYYFEDNNTSSGQSPYYAVDNTPTVSPEVPANAADWTVFIYLCGSDLETRSSCGVTDLKEIAKATIGSNVNVVIETGGSKKWHGYGIQNNELGRYILKDGKITKVGSAPNASMGKPGTLTDFLRWGAKNYPAKKYALDFWNHGSGSVNGVCFDENFNDDYGDNDSLVASELKKAFSDAELNFELFIFDTCLSATIEMADTLQNYGKYMVASEEVVMSGCLSYDTWISSLSSNPAQTGADLGKQIAQLYSKNMKNAGYSSSCTMSVLDLSRVDRVKLAFQAMAAQMTQKTQNVTSFRNLIRNGAKGVKYGSASDNEGYTNLIDLGEFAQNAAAEVPEQAQAVIDAIKRAVLFEVHGKDEGNSCGIAVYYPVKYNGDTQLYADNVDNRPYLQYLDAILDKWQAPSWVYQDKKVKSFVPVKSKNYNVAFNSYVTKSKKDPRYALQITDGLDSVASVTMNLYWYDEEANEFLYLGNDDAINADWDKGLFLDAFEGTWITIGDCYVNAELIEWDDDANYYSIPIELNGKDTNLRMKYDYNKEKFFILGVYDGIENQSASKGMRKLKKGDKIAFVFYAVSADDGSESDEDDVTAYIGGEVTYSNNLVIEDSDLFDGLYYYQYEIEDIFGNVQYSDFIEMEVEDGMIYLNTDED
ncbi:MAG: hypothetical protein K6A43_05770 [Treponema sp.]|nr:hypothetical protein [Treponema sp.]